MANVGLLESYFNGLPPDIKKACVGFVQYAFKNLRFGAPPEETGRARSENFAGALVRFTTSATANAENAVEHQLERTPRFLIPMLALDTVNDTVPVLTVTRAADAARFYVKSPSTSAECLVYVE